MLSQLQSGLGLDIVIWLQAHGNPAFDALAKVLHVVGGEPGYLLLLSLVYWGFNRQLGRRLLFTLIIVVAAVEAVKFIFQAPRPYQLYPGLVTPLVDQSGFGLPSGHVANSLALLGFIIAWLKRPRLWWPLAAYIALVGWSRMYTGVHYPQDVVVGLIVGLAALWFCLRSVDWVSWVWHAFDWRARLALVFLSFLVILVYFFNSPDGVALAGITLGGGIGVMVEERRILFSAAGSFRQRLARFVLGVVLVAALFLGLRALFENAEPAVVLRVLRYGLISFIAIAGWPWLSARIGLTEMHPLTE